MRRFINPLLLVLTHSHHAELVRQLQYLKVENEILRSKLPKPIRVTPQERSRLIRYARPLGTAIRHLVSIVSSNTMYKWMNGHRYRQGHRPKPIGRPRTPLEVQRLVLKIARETGWGYTRILGELRKLGFNSISRSTVVNILKRAGLETGPSRGQATWDEFIKRHAKTLWACDYLPRRILTTTGWRDAYVLIFINIKTRLTWISPSTFAPTRAWASEQAHAFVDSCAAACGEGEEGVGAGAGAGAGLPVRMVLHDRDPKLQGDFREALQQRRVRPLRLHLCSPNLNAYAERFIQTLQKECLNHFLIFGRRHFDHLVQEYREHYHQERPHQGLGNILLTRSPPTTCSSIDRRITCRTRLGGLLRHYRRAA